MAFLEKEVMVNVSGRNAPIFLDLGYKIPKRVDKFGNLRSVRNTKITIKIEHLPPYSRVEVTKVCDDCGVHVPNRTYSQITNDRKKLDGRDYCQSCGNKESMRRQKMNMDYEDSLEFFAKENGLIYLLEEYSSKNKVSADMLHFSTGDKCWWECSKCSSPFDMVVGNRTTGRMQNCPFCSGRRINHTNCLKTLRPDIASMLVDEGLGSEIGMYSRKKTDFKCERCGHINKKVVKDVVKQGLSCNKCSDGFSYAEKFMFGLLKQVEYDFDTQKSFSWSKGVIHNSINKLTGDKKYGFYIPELNCIIETHGDQHYGKSFETISKKSLEEEQENDRLKMEVALRNGIKNYIIIDCRFSEFKYIKNNILDSELKRLLKIDNIDWFKCHEYACSSKVKEAADMWKKGLTTAETAKKLKVANGTVTNYLKQASLLGWCERGVFNVSSERHVLQFSEEMDLVRTWTTPIAHIARTMSLDYEGLRGALKESSGVFQGYVWKYRKDYNIDN